MAQLQKPDLPPGALRDLYDELHALHVEAGRPGIRQLQGAHGARTTVAKLFSQVEDPPKNPLLMGVVQKLAALIPRRDSEAILDRFDELWRAAQRAPYDRGAAEPDRDQHRSELREQSTDRGEAHRLESDAEPEDSGGKPVVDGPSAGAGRRLAKLLVEQQLIGSGKDVFGIATTWGTQDAEVGGLLDELHAELLAEAGDAEELARLAEQGNEAALEGKADLMAEASDLSSLKTEAQGGNPYASYHLQRLLYSDHSIGKAPKFPERNRTRRFNRPASPPTPDQESQPALAQFTHEVRSLLEAAPHLSVGWVEEELNRRGEKVNRSTIWTVLEDPSRMPSRWYSVQPVLEVLARSAGRSLDDPSDRENGSTYRAYLNVLHQAVIRELFPESDW